MKPHKTTFLLLLVAFITINIQAQKSVAETPKHSHPEYEKEIQEIKTIKDNADKTYQLAQDNLNAIKEYDRRMDAREKCFLTILSLIIALTFSGAVVATIASVKAIKNSYENKFKENYEKIAEKNVETIKLMINNEEWSTKLRNEKKVLVLNQKGTGMTPEFKRVINSFKNNKFENIISLEDSLNIDFTGYDLVVIENSDNAGYWKLLHELQNSDTNEELKKRFNEETEEIEKTKRVFVKIGNLICPDTAIIYYGKQGKGFFPSEKIEESKQHMISFANTPSTLFGNMLDLLRYKDIIEGKQNY